MMIGRLPGAIVLMAALFLISGCARPEPASTMAYPARQADNPERKSGPAMLFYEAAEQDADPGNVVVTPPAVNQQAPSSP